MSDNLECTLKINKIIYPQDSYIEPGTWGILSCHPVKVTSGKPILSKYGNFTIKGLLPEINMDQTYKFIGEFVDDEKYGKQYIITYIGKEVDLTSVTDQKEFLQQILSPTQIDEIYKTLENPFESIASGDIESITKVKGIGDTLAEKIIKRYNENINYADIIVKLNKYGLTKDMIHKLITIYKSPDIIIEIITSNPYSLIGKVDGIGWVKADTIAKTSGIKKQSVFRLSAFIKHYLKQKADKGHSWVHPNELVKAIKEILGGEKLDIQSFTNTLRELKSKNILYWDDNKTFICLKHYWDLENDIKDELFRLLHSQNEFVYNNYNSILQELEKQQGWEYEDQQKEAIQKALDNNVCIITGPGGTGKSSIVSAIIKILSKYTFAQCALSGRAAARLTEVTKEEGYTIHRLLGFDPPDFAHNKDRPLEHDIIILDETSMVGGEIFYSLIQAIKDGAKLIMLGDDGQLEAIGALNIFKDMLETNVIPFIKLTKIHRQAKKSAIITESYKVRQNKQIIKHGWTGIETRGELQDLTLDIYEDKLLTAPRLIKRFKEEFKDNIMDVQIIVPLKERGNACTHLINNQIQEIYNPEDKLKEEITILKKGKRYTLRRGDKVINVKNNYKTLTILGLKSPIFNGFIGIITEITSKFMVINFDTCGKIILPKEYWKHIELAYAVTTHKSQGAEHDTVIIGIDYTAYSLLTKELVYTAMTRASKKCILCAESSALRFATNTSNVSTKQTFLQNLLKNKE